MLYCLTFISPRGLSLCITRSNVLGHPSGHSASLKGFTHTGYCCMANASFFLRYCSLQWRWSSLYSVEFWRQKCEISSQAQLEGRRGVNYLFVTDRSQRLSALCWCWYREISVIEPHALITNTCVLSISFFLFYLTQGRLLCFQGCSMNVRYLAGALNAIELPLIWCWIESDTIRLLFNCSDWYLI